MKKSVLHWYLSPSLHVWSSKYPQDLCALRCPSNHTSPLTELCAFPVLAKCYSSIQLFTLSISSSVFLDQSSLHCQQGWGCSHFTPALWSSPGCPSQRKRGLQPILILDPKSRGSVCFALIVPWCLLYQEKEHRTIEQDSVYAEKVPPIQTNLGLQVLQAKWCGCFKTLFLTDFCD